MTTPTDHVTQVSTPEAPSPFGHYVQASVLDGLVFVSGQLPARPDGTHLTLAPFEEQATQALANLMAVLKAAGSTPERVLKVTAYIVGAEHWAPFNRIYAQAFGDAKPARSVVPVPELHHGYLVEIDAVAVRSVPRNG